ncbi:protein-lysine methyltransferase METTL21C-like, partial [Clarias magur]
MFMIASSDIVIQNWVTSQSLELPQEERSSLLKDQLPQGHVEQEDLKPLVKEELFVPEKLVKSNPVQEGNNLEEFEPLGKQKVIEANECLIQIESVSGSRLELCKGIIIDGKYYQFFRGPMTAYDAEFYCQKKFPNGHLASVTSKHVHDLMMWLMQRDGGYTRTWIGGLRYLNTGRFVWLDGAQWNYTDWLLGEPNNTSNVENCVELLSTDELQGKVKAEENLEWWNSWEPSILHSPGIERFYFAGHKITIQESFDSYGALVWPGAVALCSYLETNQERVSLLDKAVLELGAGTGLVSIVACLMGAWVTATDLPDIMDNLTFNLSRNTRGRCRYTPQVAQLTWGKDLDHHFPSSIYNYDYILCADVVYYHNCLDELLFTMKHFCKHGTTLLWANK